MKVGSLFAGIGGFDLAARWIGWQTAWFSEINPYASAVLQKHWPGVPNHGDITLMKGSSLEPVDVLCGGFPCQDISLAGKGAGLEGERSGLWFQYARLIEELRPRWVVAENVSALRSRGLDQVLGSLAALGYDAEWHCIPAAAVGAPHRRDRVWIVAHPHGLVGNACRIGDAAEGEGGRNAGGSRFGPLLAYATGPTQPEQGYQTEAFGAERDSRMVVGGSGPRLVGNGSGTSLADSNGARPQGRRRTLRAQRAGKGSPRAGGSQAAHDGPASAGWWLVEPNVGRVAHGVPKRVDRLSCLGNAIVPHVAFVIFQAIAAWEASQAREAA